MVKILGINTNVAQREITKEHPDENDKIKSLEKAADIHKEVRRHLHSIIKPGVKLKDIVHIIESKTEELSNKSECINRGIGFPVGLSVNSCAAHFHPEDNDNTTIKKDDVVKIDFGTEVNGWIIDSAFTVYFNDKHDTLVKAVKEATETGIKNAGIDVDINEGEIVSIVGASGAGKTTLLQILGTLDNPSKNNVSSLEINGENLLKMKDKELSKFRNTHLGFIFQFHQLLPEFTALENVCIPNPI